MKYLKHINESIEDDIKQDIKEICFDITDDYKFIVDISLSEDEDEDEQPVVGVYNIFVHKDPSVNDIDEMRFKFYEIKEVFLRIKQYLGDRFIDFQYDNFNNSSGWVEAKLNNSTRNIKGDSFSISYKI